MSNFKFIDLFAGIGGFRIALESLGGECVFASEIDKFCRQTYEVNYAHKPENSDIREQDENLVPGHDILCGGFPCQAFSQAGKQLGFEDDRGVLFLDIVRILKAKRPKAFILENVKGLITHDKGRTLTTKLKALREDLGYFVPKPRILNAKDFGLAQNRPRVFIVGFRGDLNITLFNYPYPVPHNNYVQKILEQEVSPKYYISQRYWEGLKAHKSRHEGKDNGFGYQILDPYGVSNTIMVGGQGRERNLIYDPSIKKRGGLDSKSNTEYIRVMTPREWARLQGFPESFKIVVSDTQAYKQFGNSVAIPVVRMVARNVLLGLQEAEPELSFLNPTDWKQLHSGI